MKKITMALVAILAFALPAAAQNSAGCGWEDGVSTILGFYGNVANPANVTNVVHSGSHALYVEEAPEGGTPQVYLAYIEGLTDGDTVTASFWGYDDTPAASPSWRIWGHYALSGDVNSYAGSAGGSDTYTDGTGWSQVSWTWTFDSSGGTRDALVVEGRLYSITGTPVTPYYADDLEVSTSSSSATITLACGEDPVSVDGSTWGGVKALYR